MSRTSRSSRSIGSSLPRHLDQAWRWSVETWSVETPPLTLRRFELDALVLAQDHHAGEGERRALRRRPRTIASAACDRSESAAARRSEIDRRSSLETSLSDREALPKRHRLGGLRLRPMRSPRRPISRHRCAPGSRGATLRDRSALALWSASHLAYFDGPATRRPMPRLPTRSAKAG